MNGLPSDYKRESALSYKESLVNGAASNWERSDPILCNESRMKSLS